MGLCCSFGHHVILHHGPGSRNMDEFGILISRSRNMAVQEVLSSSLEARYASDSETDDMTLAAPSLNRAQTTKVVKGGLHQAGATNTEEEAMYDSEASSNLDDAAYLNQLAGKRSGR